MTDTSEIIQAKIRQHFQLDNDAKLYGELTSMNANEAVVRGFLDAEQQKPFCAFVLFPYSSQPVLFYEESAIAATNEDTHNG
jgi:hypothetical protein